MPYRRCNGDQPLFKQENSMPRIRCKYTDCIFVDGGYCSAALVEWDPQTGCATFMPTEEAAAEAENWEEEELEEEDEETDEEDKDTWEKGEDEF
jgi:hypothetical protein